MRIGLGSPFILFFAQSLFSSGKAAHHDHQLSLWAHIPLEMRDNIFSDWNLVEYVAVLKNIPDAQAVLASHDFEIVLLRRAAVEEAKLDFFHDYQRFRKKQILSSLRAFVRIRSGLPLDCSQMSQNELSSLAPRLEERFLLLSSFSTSLTWRKSCMAGLFGKNTLISVLPFLSAKFQYDHWELMLQAATFFGVFDIVSYVAEYVRLAETDALQRIIQDDVIYSGSVEFFESLLLLIPKLRSKIPAFLTSLIILNHTDLFVKLYPKVKSISNKTANKMLQTSAWYGRLELFKIVYRDFPDAGDLKEILKTAAKRGHVDILRFVWPFSGNALRRLVNLFMPLRAARKDAFQTIRPMMFLAALNNKYEVLEFLFHQAESYLQDEFMSHLPGVFNRCIGHGHVETLKYIVALRFKDSYALRATFLTLNEEAIIGLVRHSRLDIFQYLLTLKATHPLFEKFKLVDEANTILQHACSLGNLAVFQYLIRVDKDGKFVFPATNPAVNDNHPLYLGCRSGCLPIVKELLRRDHAGSFVYPGINPTFRDNIAIIVACEQGHFPVVEFLLSSGFEGIDVTAQDNKALYEAVLHNHVKIVEFLLRKSTEGGYVFPCIAIRPGLVDRIRLKGSLRMMTLLEQRQR